MAAKSRPTKPKLKRAAPSERRKAQRTIEPSVPTGARAGSPGNATRPSARARFAAVASESARLDSTIEAEREARMAAYSAALHTPESAAPQRMLQGKPLVITILAEGDSWFDYPLGTDVIGQLQGQIGIPIANMAHYGDEVRQMLALKQRREIEKRLSRKAPNGKPWDALLFSGGGNDFVGDQLCLWLRSYKPGMPVQDILDVTRFDAVMEEVRAGYQDLVSLRDSLSPSTKIFLHQYDFAPPNGEGVCGVGPWLQPSLKYRLIPAELQPSVTRLMLERFAQVLAGLAANAADVFVVPTQGTIPTQTREWWANELHPTDKGFAAIATKFCALLKQKFPDLL